MNVATGLALPGALVLSLAAAPAFAADVTIRIGHLNPDEPFQSASGTMTAVFKSLVESASNGEIEVQLFANGQLGKDNEVIDQVSAGVVEASISSAGGLAPFYPLVSVFDIPFAFPNIGVASRVIDLDSDFGQKFAEDVQAKTGMKVIGLLDSGGFYQFTNSEHPIASVADMDGLRIRTQTLPTHEAIVSSLGGKPTALPWAEVYTALQTGVADGQMNPITIIASGKLYEVQEYMSITNHIITPYIWLMNNDFFAGLSPEHQEIVTWAAEVATDAGRGISRVIEASDAGLPLLDENMEVNVISAEEQAKFAETAQPAVRALIEERYGDEGKAMLEALMTSIENAKF